MVVYLQLEDSKRDYVKSIDSLQSEKDDLNNKLKKANDGNIMKTCPCNEHPLTPHFYIGKLGFTGVYIIFLFLL